MAGGVSGCRAVNPLTCASYSRVSRQGVFGRRSSRHAFTLTFRTLSLPEMVDRVGQAGLVVDHIFCDYRGGPWHDDAETRNRRSLLRNRRRLRVTE